MPTRRELPPPPLSLKKSRADRAARRAHIHLAARLLLTIGSY